MGGYQRERDEHALPIYEFTCQLATMEPPPPEVLTSPNGVKTVPASAGLQEMSPDGQSLPKHLPQALPFV